MDQDQVIPPTSEKTEGYVPNSVVDFVLSFQNNRIQQSSIRVEGFLHILKNGGAPPNPVTDDISFDPILGIHGAFQGITTSCDKFGVIDEMSIEYPRHVKAKRLASVDRMEFSTNTRYLSELSCNDSKLTKFIMNGSAQSHFVVPFSFIPEIGFNNSSSDISYQKTGNLKIALRLSENEQFLFGGTAGYTFMMKNLRVRYRALPDDPKLHSQKLVFSGHHIVNSTIMSNNVTISTRIPAVCRSVVMMFIKNSDMKKYSFNNWTMQEPPNMDYCEFAWNDSTQQFVTYRIDSITDMLYNYLKVYNEPLVYNSLDREMLQESSDAFALGFKFSDTDLTNKKFSINVNSGIDNTLTYTSFLLFNTVSVL